MHGHFTRSLPPRLAAQAAHTAAQQDYCDILSTNGGLVLQSHDCNGVTFRIARTYRQQCQLVTNGVPIITIEGVANQLQADEAALQAAQVTAAGKHRERQRRMERLRPSCCAEEVGTLQEQQ